MLSMTGMSHLMRDDGEKKWDVRMIAVNNRFLDITVILPMRDAVIEEKIRALVRKEIVRGKIDIKIGWEFSSQQGPSIHLNGDILKQCYSACAAFAEENDVENTVTMADLLHLPFAWKLDEHCELTHNEQFLEQLITDTIQMLRLSREKEGAKLKKALCSYTCAMRKYIEQLRGINTKQTQAISKKIKEKIRELNAIERITEKNMLEKEIAALICKGDVAEELVRLDSHTVYLEQLFEENATVGKKIGFVLQELMREANTLGDKLLEMKGKHIVLQLKTLIERLREQSHNIE